MSDFSSLLTKSLGWIGVLLMPVKATMLSIGALVIMDLITGMWAAHKRGEKITSNGIRRTFSKSIAYQIGIIASYIMEHQFLMGVPVVHVIAGLIAVTEFKSLLENITSITGVDFIDEFIKRIQGNKIVPQLKEQPKDKPCSDKVEDPDKK